MNRINPVRLLLLIAAVLAAAIYVQGQRLSTTNWASPVEIVVYPINGDGREATASYIASLDDGDFLALDAFMAEQAARYDVPESHPFITRLGPQVAVQPPQPTPRPGDPWHSHLLWQLKFRLWAWRHTPDDYSNYRRIRVFTVYSQPQPEVDLPHSLGAQKGLLGLVHAYAGPGSEPGNQVVLAHEVLHTVGATDKYTPEGYPVFPEGFAQADREPLFPQKWAEIMAGAMAIDERTSAVARNLRQCVVGEVTAREIGWLQAE